MIVKTINLSLDVLVAFSVWCAAIVFGIMALRVMVTGGVAVYQLMHS